MPKTGNNLLADGSQRRTVGSQKRFNGAEQSSAPDPLPRNNHPQTGDDGNIALKATLMVLISGGIITMLTLNKKKRNAHLSLFLCVAVSTSVVGISPMQVRAAENNENVINVQETISVDGNELTIEGIVKYDRQLAGDDTIGPSNFSADTYDVYLNTEETVLFTVEVTANSTIQTNTLAVYDDTNQLIAYMNDDGVDGDAIANDAIYSAQATLYSEEIQLVDYYA